MRAPGKNVEMRSRRNAGFALPDAAALTIAAGLFAALVLAGASATRQNARSAASQGQLRWIAGVTQSYAADFEDRLWGLSWTLESGRSAFPDLQDPPNHMHAAAYQAIDIMRRRSVWPDLPPPSGWFPVVHCSHVVLADYLDVDLPILDFVSPGDANRLNWARDPEGYAAGAYLPKQPPPDRRRYSFSSSYQPSLGMVTDPPGGSDAVLQAETHRGYRVSGGVVMRPATVADVQSPAAKVWLFDSEQRFGAQPLYWAEPRAEPLTLRVDGAVTSQRTADANIGWFPSHPAHPGVYTRFEYAPDAWEAPADPSREERHVLGRYRYTRGGAAGRDFGGPEIDTSGW